MLVLFCFLFTKYNFCVSTLSQNRSHFKNFLIYDAYVTRLLEAALVSTVYSHSAGLAFSVHLSSPVQPVYPHLMSTLISVIFTLPKPLLLIESSSFFVLVVHPVQFITSKLMAYFFLVL